MSCSNESETENMIDLRYELAMGRISGIAGENIVEPAFVDYFESGAEWFLLMQEEEAFLKSREAETADLNVLMERNRRLYEEILSQMYKTSWANPDYASEKLGGEMGPLLAALRYEMRSVIPFVYRQMRERVLIRMELFLEVYSAFSTAYRESGGIPAREHIRGIIYQYLADYAEDEMFCYVKDKLVEGSPRIRDLASRQDGDLRNLYLTGEYVTRDEIVIAGHIGALPEETVSLIAGTITEGFKRGFINGGKNLACKKKVALIFHLGFERLFKACEQRFAAFGLRTIISAEVPTLFHSFSQGNMGYSGANPNPQYYYDHREDEALFLDESLRSRKLEGLANAYKRLREQTVLYAGPAVLETFGSSPFSPAATAAAPHFDETGQKLSAEYAIKASELYSEAVIARDRSFTIIDFPLPSVARSEEEYREIFDAVIRINTLDNALYEQVQGKMIGVLETASRVEVRGRGTNRTELSIKLFEPANPSTETNFENCTADVNIPVGEVFTTPVLEGTRGLLHVKGVYLNGLFFRDLEIRFEEGRVTDYSCRNFDSEEENRAYIRENILHNQERLPMGEFAIGTNTTAYAAAAKYGIGDRLPILIAEKTGPHFAVGDTCYYRNEENRVCNPDGKEIMAKDNSVSILRKSDPGKAYFGCHTDITIPYEELGELTAVRADGERIEILKDSRFVLEGTEILNEPLEKMGGIV